MSDVIAVWVIGAAVAFLIGCVLGLIILFTDWRKGYLIWEPVNGVLGTGFGTSCLWIGAYPVVMVVYLALGYGFGGA